MALTLSCVSVDARLLANKQFMVKSVPKEEFDTLCAILYVRLWCSLVRFVFFSSF